jgi:nitrite reductase/ring-hydroxylating ferredoxin subunit
VSGLDRRGWLRATIGIIIGAISSIVGMVVGGAVVAPGLAGRRETWVPAARLADLADGIPTPVTVRVRRLDGYYEAIDQQVVFLIKSEADGVRALSSTCTHLGCRVAYDAVRRVIKCPCHGGTFTPDGAVVAGPPPRPLPEVSARVDGARVFVQLS